MASLLTVTKCKCGGTLRIVDAREGSAGKYTYRKIIYCSSCHLCMSVYFYLNVFLKAGKR